MRQFINVLGYFSVLMVCYLGGVFVLKRFEAPDSPLRLEARSIVDAVRDYRASRLAYPVLSAQEGPLIDLKNELAKGGFLGSEVSEFSTLSNEDRYTSNGTELGLLFHGDRSHDNPTGTPCVMEFGPIWGPTGWWGQPRRCRFYSFDGEDH